MITTLLHKTYRAIQSRHPAVLCYGNDARREIALTFDDGPHPRDTPGVLEVLAKHNIPATFFLIGKDIERNKHLAKNIHEGGHQIGIHCYRHLPFPFEDSEKLRKHLEATRNLISDAGSISHEEIRDVRPPYGLFSRKTLALLTEWGFRHVLWSCIPPHFLQPLRWSVQQVLDANVSGSIIVLHDGHGHGSKTAQIVEAVVPHLKAQGFEFVTIKQMQEKKIK